MRKKWYYRLLLLLCFAMWCGLMVAGLWPFDFSSDNKVTWLGNRNGVHFEEPGQIYSGAGDESGKRRNEAPLSATSFTLEIWIQPEWVGDFSRTIVFADDPAGLMEFSLEQSVADLVVRGNALNSDKTIRPVAIYVDDCLRQGQEKLVTVTSGPQGTNIYLDGVLAKAAPYALDPRWPSSRLVLAHSASAKRTWPGSVFGLAIYRRQLTNQEVLNNYSAWTNGRPGEIRGVTGIAGFYPFDERRGELAHSQTGSMPDLVITEKFHALRRGFLDPRFKLVKSDLVDAAVNIVGFMPFGLLVSLYLHRGLSFPNYRMIWWTTLIGMATSLLIECLQAYLPTRTSSLPDVINNVLGTGLGAMLVGVVKRRSGVEYP